MKWLLSALFILTTTTALAQDYGTLSCEGQLKTGLHYYDLEGNEYEEEIKVTVLFSDELEVARLTARSVDIEDEFINQAVLMNAQSTISTNQKYYVSKSEVIDLVIQEHPSKTGELVAFVEALGIPATMLKCQNI